MVKAIVCFGFQWHRRQGLFLCVVLGRCEHYCTHALVVTGTGWLLRSFLLGRAAADFLSVILWRMDPIKDN